MFEEVLRQMRESVRRGDHIISTHARQQLLKRRLTFFDPERAILTGRIIKRQRDEITREWKYVIRGLAYTASQVEVAAKLT